MFVYSVARYAYNIYDNVVFLAKKKKQSKKQKNKTRAAFKFKL